MDDVQHQLMRFDLKWCALLGMLWLVVGCYSSAIPIQSPGPFPAHPAYILAGLDAFNDSSLTIVDTDNWHVYKRTPILASYATLFVRDPQGRIWISYQGDIKWGDNRVQVYSAEGEQISTLATCNRPSIGIHFVDSYAFVVCEDDAVDVFDLATLNKRQTINLKQQIGMYELMTSAADENTLVVYGFTGKETYLALIDTHTLSLREKIGPLTKLNVKTILPYQGKFYLLNNYDYQPPRTDDILVLQPGTPSTLQGIPTLKPLAQWAPYLSVRDENMIYIYHDPYYITLSNTIWRAISSFDLTSNVRQTWPLPAQRGTRDLAVFNKKIILAQSWNAHDDKDGLYEFDPKSGALTQLVQSLGADRVIVVR